MYIYNTKLVSYNRSQEKICLCTIEKKWDDKIPR